MQIVCYKSFIYKLNSFKLISRTKIHSFIIISSFLKKDKRYVYAVYSQYKVILLLEQPTGTVLLTLMRKRSAALDLLCFIMQALSSFNKPRSGLTVLLRQAPLSPICKHRSVFFLLRMINMIVLSMLVKKDAGLLSHRALY